MPPRSAAASLRPEEGSPREPVSLEGDDAIGTVIESVDTVDSVGTEEPVEHMENAAGSPDAESARRPFDAQERLTWVALNGLFVSIPAAVEAQLAPYDLTHFEYSVLLALAERPDRTLRMSQLALFTNGSQSRLSHVARRMEKKGYIARHTLPEDGRIIVAVLQEAGLDAIRAAAPAYSGWVRSAVLEQLTPDEQRELCRLTLKLVDAVHPTMGEVARFIAAPTGRETSD